MSSADRIPSIAQLRDIVFEAQRYIGITARLFTGYPDGKAPNGSARPHDVAGTGLRQALYQGQAVAPYGWPDGICAALEEMHRLSAELYTWCSSVCDLDRWDPKKETLALSRWEEVTAILESAIAPQEPQAPVSDPGAGTANLSPPALEKAPEADSNVWVSFSTAHNVTGLNIDHITKLCDSGKVESRGKRKGRKVYLPDLVKFLDGRSKGGG